MAAPQSSSKSNPSLAGTIWRSTRVLLLLLILAALGYVFVSVAIAFTTADNKCGHGYQGDKTWNYFPPGWECEQIHP